MEATCNVAPSNDEIARMLQRVGDLLEAQRCDPFRVRAYRAAAETVRRDLRPMRQVFESGGVEALDELPAIGHGLASVIAECVRTGGLRMLDRLERDVAAGRLPTAPRLAAERPTQHGHGPEPSVAVLLDVDREYRAKARAGKLETIAPRRFNPNEEAWLPVLHTTRDGWSFTALYSNTWRAHELHKTHEWVLLYCSRDGRQSQCTVVTEGRGQLAGLRVVRGREDACRRYYARHHPVAA